MSNFDDFLSDLRRDIAIKAKASEVESGGDAASIEGNWESWLTSVASRTFTGSFSPFHREFWDWYWARLLCKRHGQPFPDDKSVFFAIWSRGFGKSSHAEWAAIAEGALLGRGYVLYTSSTQAMANQHIQSIAERLESPEIAHYYPALSRPKRGKHGNQAGWRQDFLSTDAGWGCAGFGLDTGIRGGRLGEQRFSLIIPDDVDELHDSPAVVEKKIEILTRSILPAGTKETIVLGAQNLIHRNSIFNRIVSNQISVLANRDISGPHPAVRGLVTERRGGRDMITGGEATWEHLGIRECQDFIDKSGLQAFLAEYQHDLEAVAQGIVIPEFREEIHIISWSQFKSIYGKKAIPEHWEVKVGLDWGSTEGHPCVVSAVATSAEDSAYPGLNFLFCGLRFEADVLVDDVAERIHTELKPEKHNIVAWRMSHEAKSERDTFRRRFSLPFIAGDSKKTAGIAQMRHYLRVDKNIKHPFKDDVEQPDGGWKLGASSFYWIVDDTQIQTARDDAGLKRHRQEIVDWRWRPTPLRESGMSVDQPVKANDDAMDSLRFITCQWMPGMTPLTDGQKTERKLPVTMQMQNAPQSPEERDNWELGRLAYLQRLKAREGHLRDQQRQSDGGHVPYTDSAPTFGGGE